MQSSLGSWRAWRRVRPRVLWRSWSQLHQELWSPGTGHRASLGLSLLEDLQNYELSVLTVLIVICDDSPAKFKRKSEQSWTIWSMYSMKLHGSSLGKFRWTIFRMENFFCLSCIATEWDCFHWLRSVLQIVWAQAPLLWHRTRSAPLFLKSRLIAISYISYLRRSSLLKLNSLRGFAEATGLDRNEFFTCRKQQPLVSLASFRSCCCIPHRPGEDASARARGIHLRLGPKLVSSGRVRSWEQ
jgi:hypothetical protein